MTKINEYQLTRPINNFYDEIKSFHKTHNGLSTALFCLGRLLCRGIVKIGELVGIVKKIDTVSLDTLQSSRRSTLPSSLTEKSISLLSYRAPERDRLESTASSIADCVDPIARLQMLHERVQERINAKLPGIMQDLDKQLMKGRGISISETVFGSIEEGEIEEYAVQLKKALSEDYPSVSVIFKKEGGSDPRESVHRWFKVNCESLPSHIQRKIENIVAFDLQVVYTHASVKLEFSDCDFEITLLNSYQGPLSVNLAKALENRLQQTYPSVKVSAHFEPGQGEVPWEVRPDHCYLSVKKVSTS